MQIIEQVKALLGINDDLQDKQLEVIQKLTESHFKSYTGQAYIPFDLDFIIVEVMLKRFNRIGAEGMTSQSMEGLTTQFDPQEDFEAYRSILQRRFSDSMGAGFKLL